jgi:hypothetical protein
MPHIAISYRRGDSAQIAGRIRDRLVARYGEDSVFIDVYNVPLGAEFPQHLREVWSKADVLLALIGPAWLRSGDSLSPANAAYYFGAPLFLLLIAHYLIINALDLHALWLRIASFLIPLPFGAAFYSKTRSSPAGALVGGMSLGAIGAAGMSISASIRYDQPIWPAGTLEWLDNIEYAVIIALGFWAGTLLARFPHISRLLHHREDWVQVEIRTALELNLPIIPVLLDGATMPAATQLPKQMRALTYRAATHVHSGADFDSHMTRLIAGVDRILAEKRM